MEQGKLQLEINDLTDDEMEQREKETEMLAGALIESSGVDFWRNYFEGEFNALN